MNRTCVMVLGAASLLALAIRPSAEAESKYKPCSLLTTAEIEAVLGTAVTQTQENDLTVPDGPYKGETLSGCMWGTKSAMSASLSVIRGPRTPEQKAAGGSSIRRVLDGLKAKGWTVESANTPGALCSRATPPPSSTNAPAFASCFSEAKGFGYSVYAFSPTVTPQQVKGLADKAAGRLP
jgi:hypothetical protein